MVRNRIRSARILPPLLILLSFVLAGCYTLLKHPQIKQEESYSESEVQPARSCTDCHTEMHADGYYHDPFYRYDPFWVRRPFYAPSYYYRWRYYRSYPWWWDRYEHRRHYRDREPTYPGSLRDEPREEKKRDWHRRSGFGTGGGIGIEAPQMRSRPIQPSEEKAKPESAKVQKAEPKSSGTSGESKKQEEKEEKKEEKKQEGRSRRRKGFN